MHEYLEIIIEYLDNKIDLESFSDDFTQVHDDESLKWSIFIPEDQQITSLIEDVYVYALMFDELE